MQLNSDGQFLPCDWLFFEQLVGATAAIRLVLRFVDVLARRLPRLITEGIVRIARRHRRLGIMSFTTPTITVAMLGGSRSGPLRSARLLADSSARLRTNFKEVQND